MTDEVSEQFITVLGSIVDELRALGVEGQKQPAQRLKCHRCEEIVPCRLYGLKPYCEGCVTRTMVEAGIQFDFQRNEGRREILAAGGTFVRIGLPLPEGAPEDLYERAARRR